MSWRSASFGGGGLSRIARKRSRSRSESGAMDSSAKTKGISSSANTRALRIRTSVSLTCSTRTVELAKLAGRLMRALSSVVRVAAAMCRSLWSSRGSPLLLPVVGLRSSGIIPFDHQGTRSAPRRRFFPRDVIQRVIRLLVQERHAVGGAQAVGVQFVDVALFQLAPVQPHALAVLADLGAVDGRLGGVHLRAAVVGAVEVGIRLRLVRLHVAGGP